MYFYGEIPDYRLIGTLNPDKTPETPDWSGLMRSELGNQSQSNQIVVINLTIVIHIQVIITFFFPFS